MEIQVNEVAAVISCYKQLPYVNFVVSAKSLKFLLKAICSHSNFFHSSEKKVACVEAAGIFRISVCREMITQLTVILSGRENTELDCY